MTTKKELEKSFSPPCWSLETPETEFNYNRKRVTFGTMSVPSLNGFCHKLTQVAVNASKGLQQ